MTSEEPQKRKVWFITRPQRDPQFHPEALRALDVVTEHFTLEWRANRDLQKKYEGQLNKDGLKRENISKDGSGGRTWAAMLRTFSYVYLDDTKRLKPTKVGSKILAGEHVRENITKQILTLQIPNAYFLAKEFRPPYEEGFRIFPARFLLRLVSQSILNYYITKDEITFFAMTAKRNEDLYAVTQKILLHRKYNGIEKKGMVSDIEEQYEHRSRSDSSARDFQAAHGDVAHTFMLLCEYTDLVAYVRGDESRLEVPNGKRNHLLDVLAEYDERYLFRDAGRYPTLDLLAQANGLAAGSFKLTPYGDVKPAANNLKKINKAKQLLAMHPNPTELSYIQKETILCQVFPEDEAKKLTALLDNSELAFSEDEFAMRYLSEADNLRFEDDTGKILEALGFDVVMRPTPVNSVSTQIEILAKYGDDSCCIFDAKNYHNTFSLSASLTSHMASEYIPNYDGYDGRAVTHFGYIVSNKFSAERNLGKITDTVKRSIPDRDITGMMISAKALLGYLEYCKLNEISMEDRCRIFVNSIQNKGYSTYQELLRNGL